MISEKTIYVDKETGVNIFFIASGVSGGLNATVRCRRKTCYYKINCNMCNTPRL